MGGDKPGSGTSGYVMFHCVKLISSVEKTIMTNLPKHTSKMDLHPNILWFGYNWDLLRILWLRGDREMGTTIIERPPATLNWAWFYILLPPESQILTLSWPWQYYFPKWNTLRKPNCTDSGRIGKPWVVITVNKSSKFQTHRLVPMGFKTIDVSYSHKLS